MSEAEQELEDGVVDDAVIEGEEAEVEQVEAPKGYQTAEQWAEQGNDPADYVSEDVWKAKGDWIKQSGKQKREFEKQLNNMAAGFEQRISNQDKLHAIALDNTIKGLQSNLDDAIDRGDRDEARTIQGEIDNNRDVANSLKEAPRAAPQAPQLSEEQAEWQHNNDWIYGKSAKANHAKAVMGDIRAGASSEAEAFQLLEAELAREFPQSNPRRRQARQAEGGSPPGKAKAGAITMRDLNPEEKRYMLDIGPQVTPDGKGGVDEKAFLKMVSESRKA